MGQAGEGGGGGVELAGFVAVGSEPGEKFGFGGAAAGEGLVEDFQDEGRAEAGEGLAGALEGAEFGAFDVHLDEVAAFEAGEGGVEGDGLYLVQGFRDDAFVGKGLADRVMAGVAGFGEAQGDGAGGFGDRLLVGGDVGGLVGGEVGQEAGVFAGARLERQDAGGAAGSEGGDQAAIGADIDENAALREKGFDGEEGFGLVEAGEEDGAAELVAGLEPELEVAEERDEGRSGEAGEDAVAQAGERLIRGGGAVGAGPGFVGDQGGARG